MSGPVCAAVAGVAGIDATSTPARPYKPPEPGSCLVALCTTRSRCRLPGATWEAADPTRRARSWPVHAPDTPNGSPTAVVHRSDFRGDRGLRRRYRRREFVFASAWFRGEATV